MSKSFPDRREQLFGRDEAIQQLVERAHKPGLSAVYARPLMGKTWTLQEVARCLSNESGYLVGYHESRGDKRSHLLYVVADLYQRWLADDSDMLKQALSLWKRHKKSLVPQVGKMLGGLFASLTRRSAAQAVGQIVKDAFDGLASAQSDLLSGGLTLEPLPYEQALSLVDLVAQVSGKNIVLILDAWEKSPSLKTEHTLLESFLKHQDEWPYTHIILGVRHPDLDSNADNRAAFNYANDLARISIAATVYELPLMQSDAQTQDRLMAFLHEQVPITQQLSQAEVMALIDHFPGVIGFWTDATTSPHNKSIEQLQREAADAHEARYPELEHLLQDLDEEQNRLAIQLALLPRLDEQNWTAIKSVLHAQADEVFYQLIDAQILQDENYASYGHDTRHAVARNWFISHQRPRVRRFATQLLQSLAQKITGINTESYAYTELLTACQPLLEPLQLEASVACLIAAAQAALNDAKAVNETFFDDVYPQLIQQQPSYVPLIALALNSRGFKRSVYKNDDAQHSREFADYSAVIALPDVPDEEKAKALVNRGALYRDVLDDDAAALADFHRAKRLSDISTQQRAKILYQLGYSKRLKDDDTALADFEELIALRDAPAELLAFALIQRGDMCSGEAGYNSMADYNAVLDMPGLSDNTLASALIRLVRVSIKNGQYKSGITLLNWMIDKLDMDNENVCYAYVYRADAYSGLKRYQQTIDDCTQAMKLPDISKQLLADILINRGVAYGRNQDFQDSINDFSAVIEMPEASAEQQINARSNRAASLAEDPQTLTDAFADLAAVLAAPQASVEQIAKAYYVRGTIYEENAGLVAAKADFESLLALKDVSEGLRYSAQHKLANPKYMF